MVALAPRGLDYVAVQLPPSSDTALTVAANIIDQYGKRGLRRLLYGFQRGRTNVELAPVFGVSPQRVHQWRGALGATVTRYTVHEDMVVLAHADEP